MIIKNININLNKIKNKAFQSKNKTIRKKRNKKKKI